MRINRPKITIEKMRYSREQLKADLRSNRKLVKQILRYEKTFYPQELDYIIGYLVDSTVEKTSKQETTIDSNILFIFSFFVSSQKDFKYNKTYLAAQIKKFEDFIKNCRSFFTLALSHFNAFLNDTDTEQAHDVIITYNDFLHLKYVNSKTSKKRWRACIHPEKLANLSHIQQEKARFEILDKTLKPIISFSFTSPKSNYRIKENHETIKYALNYHAKNKSKKTNIF